jgi:hypothetical protein
MNVTIPEKLALSAIGDFLQVLDRNIYIPEPIFIDFSRLTYSYPFSTLAIGSGLRHFVRKRAERNFQTHSVGIDNRNVHSYLSHVGFFNYIYLPHGNGMGASKRI